MQTSIMVSKEKLVLLWALFYLESPLSPCLVKIGSCCPRDLPLSLFWYGWFVEQDGGKRKVPWIFQAGNLPFNVRSSVLFVGI